MGTGNSIGTAFPELSARQLEVLELVDQRLTTKEIAARLDISDTRVNQIIRALKTKLGEETLAGLVKCYREEFAGPGEDHWSFSEYEKMELPAFTPHPAQRSTDEAANFVLSDVRQPMPHLDWRGWEEPRIVPRALDGANAILARALAMVAILFGILASIVLCTTAMGVTSGMFFGT